MRREQKSLNDLGGNVRKKQRDARPASFLDQVEDFLPLAIKEEMILADKLPKLESREAKEVQHNPVVNTRRV